MDTVTRRVSKFSDRVRQARLELGISVEKLAERIGIARQTVTCYENGSKEPSLETLPKLAGALGKPVGYFFDDPPQAMASLEEVRRSYDPVEVRLAKIEGMLGQLLAQGGRDRQAEEDAELFARDALGRPYDDPALDAQVPEDVRPERKAARMPPGTRRQKS